MWSTLWQIPTFEISRQCITFFSSLYLQVSQPAVLASRATGPNGHILWSKSVHDSRLLASHAPLSCSMCALMNFTAWCERSKISWAPECSWVYFPTWNSLDKNCRVLAQYHRVFHPVCNHSTAVKMGPHAELIQRKFFLVLGWVGLHCVAQPGKPPSSSPGHTVSVLEIVSPNVQPGLFNLQFVACISCWMTYQQQVESALDLYSSSSHRMVLYYPILQAYTSLVNTHQTL